MRNIEHFNRGDCVVVRIVSAMITAYHLRMMHSVRITPCGCDDPME